MIARDASMCFTMGTEIGKSSIHQNCHFFWLLKDVHVNVYMCMC